MKKKHKKEFEQTVDFKSLIHEHSLFFDKLVESIPAKFYLPVEDKEKPWFQGLSKAAKAYAKKETRENIKKARRLRLDPEKNSTTLDMLKETLEREKLEMEMTSENEQGGENVTEIQNSKITLNEDPSITYEQLRERLHRRIEQLRSNRNTSDKQKNQKHDKPKNPEDTKFQMKRKQDVNVEEKKMKCDDNKKDHDPSTSELVFGHVKIGRDDNQSRKKRKISKIKELEKAQELAAAKKDPEKGEIVSKKHSWKAATCRAAGIKVHDDPKLLKESIKKEKKRHQKNAQKWKERVQNQEKVMAEKQQTRTGNIAERVHNKKMRRIAKREKKLMRPGFEGRKQGYVNET